MIIITDLEIEYRIFFWKDHKISLRLTYIYTAFKFRIFFTVLDATFLVLNTLYAFFDATYFTGRELTIVLYHILPHTIIFEHLISLIFFLILHMCFRLILSGVLVLSVPLLFIRRYYYILNVHMLISGVSMGVFYLYTLTTGVSSIYFQVCTKFEK